MDLEKKNLIIVWFTTRTEKYFVKLIDSFYEIYINVFFWKKDRNKNDDLNVNESFSSEDLRLHVTEIYYKSSKLKIYNDRFTIKVIYHWISFKIWCQAQLLTISGVVNLILTMSRIVVRWNLWDYMMPKLRSRM